MKPSAWKAYGRYGTVGLELILSMIVGYLVGRWVDRHLGTTWVVWVGSAAGIYAGFRAMFKAAKQMQRDAERADAIEAERRAEDERRRGA
jgi:F0F1-type ATP synthase assembly protein I